MNNLLCSNPDNCCQGHCHNLKCLDGWHDIKCPNWPTPPQRGIFEDWKKDFKKGRDGKWIIPLSVTGPILLIAWPEIEGFIETCIQAAREDQIRRAEYAHNKILHELLAEFETLDHAWECRFTIKKRLLNN
jgi:hypothetical protein